jgi:hypothetical protein
MKLPNIIDKLNKENKTCLFVNSSIEKALSECWVWFSSAEE